MDSHQRRVIGRVAEEIQAHREGRLSLRRVLHNTWGLFTAADLYEDEIRERFLDLYYAVDGEDDLRQPGMPAGLASDEHLETALSDLEDWAIRIRDGAG